MNRASRLTISLAVTCLLVWLLFRGTDWAAVATTLRGSRPGWILLALGFAFLSHATRVWRWTVAVTASSNAGVRPVFSAAQIGFLFNVALPLRIGDAVRALVLARTAPLPIPRAVALVAVDRAADLFGLLAVLLVALVSFPTDATYEISARALGGSDTLAVSANTVRTVTFGTIGLIVALLFVLVGVYWKKEAFVRSIVRRLDFLPGSGSARAGAAVSQFASGMHIFRSASGLVLSLVISLLAWSCGVLMFAAAMHGLRIEFEWYAPFLLQTMVAALVAVPITPGLIGQFPLGVVVGLAIAVPGLAAAPARAAALAMYGVGLLPIVALGGFALLVERMSFLELTRASLSQVAASEGTDRDSSTAASPPSPPS